jgi:hypothetical protein
MFRPNTLPQSLPKKLNDKEITIFIRNFLKQIGEYNNELLLKLCEDIFKNPFIHLEAEQKLMFSPIIPTEILNFLLSCAILLSLDLKIYFPKHAHITLRYEIIEHIMLCVRVAKATAIEYYAVSKYIRASEFNRRFSSGLPPLFNRNYGTIHIYYVSLFDALHGEENIIVVKSSTFHEVEEEEFYKTDGSEEKIIANEIPLLDETAELYKSLGITFSEIKEHEKAFLSYQQKNDEKLALSFQREEEQKMESNLASFTTVLDRNEFIHQTNELARLEKKQEEEKKKKKQEEEKKKKKQEEEDSLLAQALAAAFDF